MKHASKILSRFPVIFVSVLLGSAAALPARAEISYDACVTLAGTDPASALDMARELQTRRGEAEAGGKHCEALALSAMGRQAEAGAAFFDLAERMLQASDEQRAQIYVQAGDAWALGNQGKLAIKAYDNAIARMPEEPAYYAGRARLKALAEEWEGARDDAAEALALDPNYTEPMLLRAAANRTLGYPQAALVDANNAVELSPHSLDALLERGRVHLVLGQRREARADWQSVIDYATATGRLADPAAVAARRYLSQ